MEFKLNNIKPDKFKKLVDSPITQEHGVVKLDVWIRNILTEV